MLFQFFYMWKFTSKIKPVKIKPVKIKPVKIKPVKIKPMKYYF